MLDPFLTQILPQTRAMALDYWRKGFKVEEKPDRTLVTEADKGIENLFRTALLAQCPHDGIYGEEFGQEALDAQRVWVIDPIDGTQAFVMGIPVFSTLLALIEDGELVQAVADFPALDLQVTAVKGQGAFLNGEQIRVGGCQDLAAAVMTATSPHMFDGASRAYEQLAGQVQATRYGLDAYGFCSLARGRADLVVEANLQPYDYMAPSLIVEEAGGLMTDWSGAALNLKSGDKVLAAASPRLHADALKFLNPAA